MGVLAVNKGPEPPLHTAASVPGAPGPQQDEYRAADVSCLCVLVI